MLKVVIYCETLNYFFLKFSGGALKHITYEDLRKCILRCDKEVLTENLLQALIQYIPAPDQLNRLKEFEKVISRKFCFKKNEILLIIFLETTKISSNKSIIIIFVLSGI